jgi:hypothetical protein
VCVTPPPVPVIVNVKVPSFVVDVVATVSVDVSADGTSTGFGLKLAVEAAGSPLTVRVTGPVKPLLGVIEIEYVAVFPRTTVTVAGDALSAKSGGGGFTVM